MCLFPVVLFVCMLAFLFITILFQRSVCMQTLINQPLINFPIGGGYAQCPIYTENTQKNGQNSGGREALNSRGKGTGREALLGERQD